MATPTHVEIIGRLGDRLWVEPLAEGDAEGGPVPLTEWGKPFWSLVYSSTSRLDEQDRGQGLGFLAVVPLFPFMVLIDAVHLLARIGLYLPVLVLWWLEARVARWWGRRWFCVVCHHGMHEPFPCCPHPDCPRPVQPRLRPSFNSLFRRSCSGCRRSSWWILGARLWNRPSPLVCRHTASTSGCYRPLLIPALATGTPGTHVALAGTKTASKNAVLGHLVRAWTERGLEPAADVSAAEVQLARTVLVRAGTIDTRPMERTGQHWTLASTLVLAEGERLLALHNLLGGWFRQTARLSKHGPNWRALDCLVFVLDGDELRREPEADSLPASEWFARIVRVTEEYCGLPAGARLPFRVAVVLAGSGPIEATIARHDPALGALLRRTVRPGRLAFFGGVLPSEPGSGPVDWARPLAEWIGP